MNYVNGFLFSNAGGQVALIKKEKPDWQKGRLNGIGGKIEEGESPVEAMQREFKEETGADVVGWQKFATLFHSGHVVEFFVAYRDVSLSSPTAEKVDWYDVNDISNLPVIGNLKWLIPLAADPDSVTAIIKDKTTPWITEADKQHEAV